MQVFSQLWELGFSEASFNLVVLALKWIAQFSLIMYDLYLYNARQAKPTRHTVRFSAQNISHRGGKSLKSTHLCK